MITNKEIADFIESNVSIFHKARLEKLKTIKIKDLLKKKNPYLFKSKNINIADELIKSMLDPFLSSSEETIFGDFLEKLAIFINNKVYGGEKSSAKGIDLEFDKDNIKYLISIKSSFNWGNSSQIEKLEKDFNTAKKILRTSGNKIENIVAINGCCYGTEYKDNGSYLKICGQKFWSFISGDDDLYIKIIEPLGYKAKEKNEKFNKEYAKIRNILMKDFIIEFCDKDGAIDWKKIVKFNSQIINKKENQK
ncbi:MAG: PmeII family type II restriction endonuclease [Rickettsiales bacterium]|nr:MAG: PmeII family type II restriction endonuclease [Rickettsiales bacterium]